MPGRIYLLDNDGETLRSLEEQPYDSEQLLQGLLEKHPDLLAGDQIDETAPRRWLLEVCPASTLKQEGLYRSYKGKTDAHRMARARILESLERTGYLVIAAQAIRSLILEDPGGDALDSVIAALASCRALSTPTLLTAEANEVYALEGRVYV